MIKKLDNIEFTYILEFKECMKNVEISGEEWDTGCLTGREYKSASAKYKSVVDETSMLVQMFKYDSTDDRLNSTELTKEVFAIRNTLRHCCHFDRETMINTMLDTFRVSGNLKKVRAIQVSQQKYEAIDALVGMTFIITGREINVLLDTNMEMSMERNSSELQYMHVDVADARDYIIDYELLDWVKAGKAGEL